MKRRIAFISEHASPLATLGGVDAGGQNVYVGKLACSLAKLGYEIDIFTRWDDLRLPMVIDWEKGVRVIHIKAGPVSFLPKEKLFKHMTEFKKNMVKFIKNEKEQYKLVHANFWMSAIVAVKIKKELKIPFVVTFHALGKLRKIFQGSRDKFPEDRFGAEELAIREAESILAECPQDREDLIKYYRAFTEKITIIPAGFDPGEFYPVDKLLSRLVLNLDPNEQVILQLGRMVPRKGVDNVIKGLKALRKSYKVPARLIIVGGDSDIPDPQVTPEIGRLKEIAKKEGVSDYVTFVGRKGREALKYFYNAADIFVSTPWYEPFGMTPVESMACGTPVVGSKVGGIKYTISDGKTGYLVPPKNPRALAQKLADILKNKKIANFFRENAIKRVNNQFSWSKVASLVSKLYETVLLRTDQITPRERELSTIEANFNNLAKTVEQCQITLRIPILDAVGAIAKCISEDGKVLVCGNGGSAADSQHFAAELVGRYLIPYRKGLPVISLNADTSVITAWGNDFSYDEIFARQVNSLGQRNDVFIGISTSGNSKNINLAFAEAHKKGMVCIALLGKGGGEAVNICDIAVVVPSDDTQRIQEIHTNIIHTICELVEKQLFDEEKQEKYIPSYAFKEDHQIPISFQSNASLSTFYAHNLDKGDFKIKTIIRKVNKNE